MKKIILLLLIVAIGQTSLWAQKTKSKTPPTSAAMSFERGIYNRAMNLNDYSIAISSMYRMIGLDSANKGLEDTLCLLYYSMGANEQTALLADEILARDPNNILIRQVSAIANQQAGMNEAALKDYLLVYASTHKIKDLYQIATLQYGLKRFGECMASCEKITSDSTAMITPIQIAISENDKQTVRVAAAAINLEGMVALEMGHWDDAKAFFVQALKLSNNNFDLPRNALEYIASKENSKETQPK